MVLAIAGLGDLLLQAEEGFWEWGGDGKGFSFFFKGGEGGMDSLATEVTGLPTSSAMQT